METSEQEPGTILAVDWAEDTEYSAWSREIYVVVATVGETTVEKITLHWDSWNGYSADYNGADDDLRWELECLTQEELYKLDGLANKAS